MVGAGLGGLAAALALARQGDEVVLLERHRVGAGASGRTGGIVLEATHVGALPGVEACIEHLQRLVDREALACDLHLGGCLELAHGGVAAPGSGAGPPWHDQGRPLRVAARVPGGTLDPGALLTGLARAALAAGVAIAEGVEVRAVALGRPLHLETSLGRVAAERAILALNAETALLLDLPGATAPEPLLALALCTGPLPANAREAAGIHDHLAFYTTDLPYLWGRALPGGRLLLGGAALSGSHSALAQEDLARGEARARLAALEARLHGLHPALARAPIAARWGGLVGLLRGRPPLLARHPRAPHLVVTGGYTGHGVALALRVGALAAEALRSGQPLPAWGALA